MYSCDWCRKGSLACGAGTLRRKFQELICGSSWFFDNFWPLCQFQQLGNWADGLFCDWCQNSSDASAPALLGENVRNWSVGLPDSLVLSDPFASFSNLAIGQMVFDAAASALLGKTYRSWSVGLPDSLIISDPLPVSATWQLGRWSLPQLVPKQQQCFCACAFRRECQELICGSAWLSGPVWPLCQFQ